MRSLTRATRVSAVIAVGLLLAACGSDDDAPGTTSAGTTATTAASTTESPTTEASTEPSATEAAGASTTDSDTGSTEPESSEPDSTGTGTGTGTAADLSALEDECASEGGTVNLIALPDEWANYKGILAAFGEKYPDVEHPVPNPNASSQEELDAIVNLAGQDDMPDAHRRQPGQGRRSPSSEGLWEPYQPTTWDEIPDNLKDPDGNWVAAYYGVMAIGTNTTIVAERADDVGRPEEARVRGHGRPQRRPARAPVRRSPRSWPPRSPTAAAPTTSCPASSSSPS